MIDVDDLRRVAHAVRGMSGGLEPALVRISADDALDLADELEAARKVVEQARRIRAIFAKDGVLSRAIDAYDEATR